MNYSINLIIINDVTTKYSKDFDIVILIDIFIFAIYINTTLIFFDLIIVNTNLSRKFIDLNNDYLI